jgi:hypothetical protein
VCVVLGLAEMAQFSRTIPEDVLMMLMIGAKLRLFVGFGLILL